MTAHTGDGNGTPRPPEPEPDAIEDFLQRGPPGFRTAPHNFESEVGLLGAILISNDAYHQVSDFLRPEHFYEPVNSAIYTVIASVIKQGLLADPILIHKYLDNPDAPIFPKELKPIKYLAALVRGAETILNARDYGLVIHDLAVRRGLIAQAEAAVNQAYDLSLMDKAGDVVGAHYQQIVTLAAEAANATRQGLAMVDLVLVAEGQIADVEWAIERQVPLGCAGLMGGPQAAGKTFFELFRMICLLTQDNFFGAKIRPVECAIGYFSEDSKRALESYTLKICRYLQLDPRELIDRLYIYSTFGQHRTIFEADRDATQVKPTPWLDEIRRFAVGRKAGWLAFDHLIRYCAFAHTSPNQVFSLFQQLDALASELAGNVVILSHPSKGDMRAGTKGVIQIGGSAAMVQAPRFVHTLRRSPDDENGNKVRRFGIEKVSYGHPYAIRLVEGPAGVVEFESEMGVDDDEPHGKSSKPRGRPSGDQLTVEVLADLYHTSRRSMTLQEIVDAKIARGQIREAPDPKQMAARREVVRRHLYDHRDKVDIRTDGTYAMKP